MQAGIARSGRTILAASTAAAMMVSVILVLAGPASAAHDPHDDTVANDGQAGTNESPYWVGYLATERSIAGATCSKINQNANVSYVLGSPSAGKAWVLLVVKQGETNFLFYDPLPNHAYPSPGNNGPGYSHIIVCSVTTTATTTTTLGDSTTTTVGDSTTTTVGDSTTTTVGDSTTTTVGDSTTTTVGDSTTTTVSDTTTTLPPGQGQIIVEKVVLSGDASAAFTFVTDNFSLGDDTLADGESSSSGPLDAGGYGVAESLPEGWSLISATCSDGSAPDAIDLGEGETVTCTFTNFQDEVLAAIVLTVSGVCAAEDGSITVTMSVTGGAQVVIRDSNDDVVGNLSADGTIKVPDGATYTWDATANEGFEFPLGFDNTGSVTIGDCGGTEVLPFTGFNGVTFAALAIVLVILGELTLLVSHSARRGSESASL